MKQNRKAQEEIVGFVLIILLVAVIAVVLLSLSLRGNRESEGRESEIINSFIISVQRYTTYCEFNGLRQNINELIRRCGSGGNCDDRTPACEYLENELNEILKNSLYIVSEDSPVKRTKITIASEVKREIMVLENKVDGFEYCPGTVRYNQRNIIGRAGEEDILFKFEVCRIV